MDAEDEKLDQAFAHLQESKPAGPPVPSLDQDRLQDLVDGLLPEGEAATAARHLVASRPSRERLLRIVAADQEVAALPDAEAQPAALSPVSSIRRSRFSLPVGLAAAILLMAWLVYEFRPGPEPAETDLDGWTVAVAEEPTPPKAMAAGLLRPALRARRTEHLRLAGGEGTRPATRWFAVPVAPGAVLKEIRLDSGDDRFIPVSELTGDAPGPFFLVAIATGDGGDARLLLSDLQRNPRVAAAAADLAPLQAVVEDLLRPMDSTGSTGIFILEALN